MIVTDVALPMAVAAAAGIGGSVHCAAMCGGIATLAGAVPREDTCASRFRRPLLIQIARIAGYCILGAVLAALTHGVAIQLPAGVEGLTRFALSLCMAALALRVLLNFDVLGAERLGARAFRRLAPAWKWILGGPVWLRPVGFGLIWGFMPCGLVYSVLPVAAATGSPLLAAAVMATFGLATAPALVAFSYAAPSLTRRLASAPARFVVGALVLLSALWTGLGPLYLRAHDHAAHVHVVAAMAHPR